MAFGLFEADLRSGELWKAGIKLPRQPFRVLAELLARPGEVVTREDLQREIWGANTNVDFDQAIAAAINKIREALGDSAENPIFIQTLTKRGYRFIAPVTQTQPAPGLVLPTEPGGQGVPDPPSNSNERHVQEQASPVQDGVILNERRIETPAGTASPRRTISKRQATWLYVSLTMAVFITGVLVERSVLSSPPQNLPYRVQQVTHHIPISLGPPNPESFLTMAMDGDRILTSVVVNGLPRLSAINPDTGEVQRIAVPDEIASNSLAAISSDGSRLLLRGEQSTESEQPLWVVPSAGGSGRRVPGVLAHDAAWMPDGASILFANGNDLEEIGPNEDLPKPYAKLPGRAFWLRWSPDGKLLRFTLFNPITHAAALWEMEGSQKPTPVKISGMEHTSACCGVWLPDGASYVFQSNDNLWQLKGARRRPTLIQLTNGPLRSLSPVVAREGNRVFFVGLEAPSGLQQLDLKQSKFRPAMAFLADANRIDFSRDGKWVAWTDIYQKLWRARVDGSDKVRLTSDALEVFLAHWSPDGRRLAAMARKPGGVWQIYLVDANGGTAEVLLDEARNEADPGWSADGESLVFGRESELMGKESGSHTLQIMHLSNHRLEQIPNSEGLFSPRWSPDGRWIVALALNQKDVMLYDVARGRWQHLASTSASDPVWGADSQAIYLHAFLADREPILMVDVPSGVTKTVGDLGNFMDGAAGNYFFGGITPRGEPLVQPRVGTGNIYSIDLTPTP
jgi:Tol biopolymer transport system component/DNA-binding winged helix-turn-helix (wHTH) protein